MVVCSIGYRRLSPELFLQIFDHCLAATECDAKTHLGVNLSHVSKSWRRLALDHSPLWTKISSKKPMTPSVVHMVLQHIRRSKKRPLDIQLYFHSKFDEQEPGDVTLVMEALAAQIARWRTIHIVVPRREFFPEPFLRFRQLISMKAAPLLEGASFNPPFNFDDEEDSILKMCAAVNFTTQIFRGGAPSLRFLRLTGCGFPLFLPPLQSITNLQIVQSEFEHSILVYKELQQILSLPNLETLLLAGDNIGNAVDFPDDRRDPPIRMPCLRNFYYDSTCGFFLGLIDIMDPCCIERMVLRGFEGSLAVDPPELFQSLSTLDLLNGSFDLDSAIFLMKMAPNLRTLNFVEARYRDRANDSESEEDPHEIIYGPGDWRRGLGIAHDDVGGGDRDFSEGRRHMFIDMLDEADTHNFRPWRSLSTLRYAPFLTYPICNAMSRWLSRRKRRGAPSLSLLQVPDWWFHEKWDRFQPEMRRIRRYVGQLDQWDGHENWVLKPAPPESELAVEDVRFHSRDNTGYNFQCSNE